MRARARERIMFVVQQWKTLCTAGCVCVCGYEELGYGAAVKLLCTVIAITCVFGSVCICVFARGV